MYQVMSLSCDKVSIVGRMKSDEYGTPALELLKNQNNVFLTGYRDYKSPQYDWTFKLLGSGSVRIGINSGRTDNSNFRIEFNPNKTDEFQDKVIREWLLPYVKNKEFTRIDLALDITGPDLSRGWEIIDEHNRKPSVYGGENWRNGIETYSLGTQNSEVMTVIYNKALEQKIPGAVPGEWWRIEERIAKRTAWKWEEYEWFKGIIIRESTGRYKLEELKPDMRARVIACLQYPDMIYEFAKATQAKIRKAMKGLKREDTTEIIPHEVVYKEMAHQLGGVNEQLKGYIDNGKASIKQRISKERAKQLTDEWLKFWNEYNETANETA